MTLLESVGAVAGAAGDGSIDWDAVVAAATASTPAGSLSLAPGERDAVAADVRAAARHIGATAGLDFDAPATVELQHRHHWIESTAATFGRVLAPLQRRPDRLPGLARRANTATMATSLAVLGRAVIGQYDPILFGEGEPRLTLVRPNLRAAEASLAVDADRFRRWIAFHEVAHAAEFGAAPWLVDHVEAGVGRVVDGLAAGHLDADAARELDATMTVVEGYAELLMDRAFDGPADDLRAALDARRRGGGPVAFLLRRLLGLGVKRRQYERGRAFFDAVAAARGIEAAGAVWAGPDALPGVDELDEPARWLARVDP